MNVGQNIRKIRKEKGLTQKQLANILAVSEPMISQYEAKKTLKIETIKKISDALGVTMSELLNFEDVEYNDIEKYITLEFRQDEEIHIRELNTRGIRLIYELIGRLYNPERKNQLAILNDNGMSFQYTDLKALKILDSIEGIKLQGQLNNLIEVKELNDEELKAIEKDVLNYLDFLLDKALKEKEVIER